MFWWRAIPLSRGLHVNRWLKETLKSVKEQIVKYWCIDCKMISTIFGRYPEAPDYVGESAGADLPRYWWLNLDNHLHIPQVYWHHRRVQSRGKISEQTGVFRRVRSAVQTNFPPLTRADLEARYTSKGDVVSTCAPDHGHVNPMTWEQWLQKEGS